MRRSRRAIAVVYGNCQASVLAHTLAATPAFAERYEVSPVPAVQDVTDATLRHLYEQVSRAQLIITQSIRDDWGGRPVGSEQLLARRRRRAKVLRFPALYSDSAIPYQVVVRSGEDQAARAPLTVDYDLRAISLAARGAGADEVPRALPRLVASPEAIRAAAAKTDARLRQVETQSDLRVVDFILAPVRRAEAFWTVNHPRAWTLDVVRTAILGALDVDAVAPPSDEFLGAVQTPVEAHVLEALGAVGTPSTEWVVDGRRHANSHVVACQVQHLREHPEILGYALDQHSERLATLGL